MVGSPEHRLLFDQAMDEHLKLMLHTAELCEWLDEVEQLGMPRFGEMACRIQPLRDELASHFAEEERDGFLAVPLQLVPEFRAEAAELCLQHSEMLRELDHLFVQLHETDPPFASWQDAHRRFEHLLSSLRQHEQREAAIYRAAFEPARG